MITCDAGKPRKEPGIRRFDPIGTYEHPDFPGNRLFFPPLMEVLNYCYTREVTHLHSATMGPVGLTALAVARILKLPVYGTCQHSLSDCFPFLGADESVGEILHRFQLWYYDQLDRVYVFCEQDATDLRQMGVQPGKIRIVPRRVDLRRFHPGRRNGHLDRFCGLQSNLKILCDATSADRKEPGSSDGSFQNPVPSRERHPPDRHRRRFHDGRIEETARHHAMHLSRTPDRR